MAPAPLRRFVVGLTSTALVCGVVMAAQGSAAVPEPAPAVPLTAQQRAAAVYAAMSTTERIGQLVMAGVPSTGSTAKQRATLRKYAVGNVYLAGNSKAKRTKVRAVVTKVGGSATHEGARPFVSVDQEGGQVQRLTGSGFSRMPSALKQGKLSAKSLRARSTTWARQLSAAGVNLDLAPVADVVPKKKAKTNQPIGRYDREYGHTPARVSSRVAAFVGGMEAGGVSTSVKHFPGLGRATGNTDTSKGVTDPTTRYSPYLRPFRAGVAAGSAFVMVSSAIYPHIDAKRRACFSPVVMNAMLRSELGFGGVIISDDLGATALRSYKWSTRATRFLNAGGTMLLTTSTVHVAAMSKAVRAKAAKDAVFAARVKAAVMRVLVAKANAGLLG